MKISANGLGLLIHFEGFRDKAYRDSAGVWTIGYGSTKGVHAGQRITRDQAAIRLADDVSQAESAVSRLVAVPLTQGQFDALVSFVYNLGAGGLAKSTLLKRLNAGDYPGAADEFLKWVKAGGRRLQGLVRRRAAERALFLTGEDSTNV